jgi:hypothetical protein
MIIDYQYVTIIDHAYQNLFENYYYFLKYTFMNYQRSYKIAPLTGKTNGAKHDGFNCHLEVGMFRNDHYIITFQLYNCFPKSFANNFNNSPANQSRACN